MRHLASQSFMLTRCFCCWLGVWARIGVLCEYVFFIYLYKYMNNCSGLTGIVFEVVTRILYVTNRHWRLTYFIDADSTRTKNKNLSVLRFVFEAAFQKVDYFSVTLSITGSCTAVRVNRKFRVLMTICMSSPSLQGLLYSICCQYLPMSNENRIYSKWAENDDL